MFSGTVTAHVSSGTAIKADVKEGYVSLDIGDYNDDLSVVLFISDDLNANKIATVDRLIEELRKVRAGLTSPRPSLVSLHGGMSAEAPTSRGDE